jgi:hypothetical protein
MHGYMNVKSTYFVFYNYIKPGVVLFAPKHVMCCKYEYIVTQQSFSCVCRCFHSIVIYLRVVYLKTSSAALVFLRLNASNSMMAMQIRCALL